MPTCPFCSSATDYTRISTHWTTNPNCPGPSLTPTQRQLTHGLMLSGASYHQKETNRYPSIQLNSTQREFLEWVRETYGILAEGQEIQYFSADEVAESFGFDEERAPNIRAQYRLRTYSSEVFDAFAGPRVYPLSPMSVRVWFARNGATTISRVGQYHLHIGLAHVGEADWLRRFKAYDGLAWSASTPDSSPKVALYRKQDITEFLDAHEVVPGYEWKWDSDARKPTDDSH